MSQANFTDDATSVVKAIQDGVETAVLKIGELEYTTRPVFFPPEKSNGKALQITTLDGLMEYLNQNADAHDSSKLIIVVDSPRSVSVYSQTGSAQEARMEWLECEYEVEPFPFGRYLDHEQFMVHAQALLCDDGDRADLLRYVGNLTTARIQTSTDDGISQTVVVETGVRKADVELPNPVELAPYRTFSEINQPPSPFVVRVKQSKEGLMPEIALFEADGGLWKIDAITEIKRYLKAKLETPIPVIG